MASPVVEKALLQKQLFSKSQLTVELRQSQKAKPKQKTFPRQTQEQNATRETTKASDWQLLFHESAGMALWDSEVEDSD